MPNCSNCTHSQPSKMFRGEHCCEMGLWFGKVNMPIDDIECHVFTPDINDQTKVSVAEVAASALVVVESLELAMSLLDQVEVCPYLDGWPPEHPHNESGCDWCSNYAKLKKSMEVDV